MSQHSLTHDPWTVDAVPEFGLVPLAALMRIERSNDAIHAIARLVGNSARDAQEDTKALDAWTIAALMGGLESLCDHLHGLADTMMVSAESCLAGQSANSAIAHSRDPA